MISIFFSCSVCFAQPFDTQPPLFDQQDIKVAGRVRQLTMEQVFEGKEKEVVVLSRSGRFPKWKGTLSFWKFETAANRMKRQTSFDIPNETILYGFIQGEGNAKLILVLHDKIQVASWDQGRWKINPNLTAPIRSASEISYGSLAQPFDPMVGLKENPSWFWVPTLDGYQIFAIEKDQICKKASYSTQAQIILPGISRSFAFRISVLASQCLLVSKS